jgi:cation diffusion facilitator CzcD-associated flavoprotein CzcO
MDTIAALQRDAGTGGVETADVLIAGTGFAGLCAAIKLQEAGNPSFLLLEKAQDFGGTWRDNVYPGCACDIPSHLYSFSFEPNPDWSRMYPPQAEIFRYLQGVAEKHDLRGRTRFGAELQEAAWDEAQKRWSVRTADGRIFHGRVLISAMGPLHIPAYPDLPGRKHFAGPQFHSAAWDFSVDMRGKRVAVIGTGASAIQFIPHLASQAGRLTVFQRTPPWVMPKFDFSFTDEQKSKFRHTWHRRLYRARLFWLHDIRALSFLGNRKMIEKAEALARRHLHKRIKNPALRAKLTPDYRIGCKRILISNDYYPALAQENVEVVTEGVMEMLPDAIVTKDGVKHPADVIVYGTGFHTTDSFARLTILGRNGVALNDVFASGMHAYRGLAVPGFPNLFFLLGPNTGLGHNSVVLMIEAQMRYLTHLFARMARKGAGTVDVKPKVEEAWNNKLQQRISTTVWNDGGCKSWYLDATGRNTTIWPGFVAEYQARMRWARLKDYNFS